MNFNWILHNYDTPCRVYFLFGTGIIHLHVLYLFKRELSFLLDRQCTLNNEKYAKV